MDTILGSTSTRVGTSYEWSRTTMYTMDISSGTGSRWERARHRQPLLTVCIGITHCNLYDLWYEYWPGRVVFSVRLLENCLGSRWKMNRDSRLPYESSNAENASVLYIHT